MGRITRHLKRPVVRLALTVGGSIGVGLTIAVVLAGRWPELTGAIASVSVLTAAVAVVLQIIALVSRSEAWHVSVTAAGGQVARRRLYRASSVGVIGGVLNGQLAVAARIAALRRSAPVESPPVPALLAAELPILIVEVMLAALTSFTLVGPLGLPWWVPLIAFAVVLGLSAGLRRLAAAKGRWLADGLAIMRTLNGRNRIIGFVLIAVAAQIARNWMLLHAVGVNASVFDAIAVLIAVVSLSQLPVGPSLGAAAALLILGAEGVAPAAAAGVLLTATGTVGGLAFAGWAAADGFWCSGCLRAARQHLRVVVLAALMPRGSTPWAALGALPTARRRIIERAYFGGLSHRQIIRTLGVMPAA